MFQQKNRLKREKDIQTVFKGGKSVFDTVCGVKFKANGLKDSRFAVVVGTKVHKSAVKRNRVRRQYREIVKSHLEELKAGVDVILLVSKKALELDFSEKEAKLMRVFKKAGLI